ncbi:MAG: hypothetical protein R6U41_06115 [Desulfosalsimonas sp.]|uniref:hypothetical protein n=1 Tax=Desulfosalsimonas sp. TaxID=3073848 RepID=UPI00397073BF
MAVDVAQQRRDMEARLRALVREAEEMDAKIRAYLADRDNKPHPRHQEFIERIQNMRIDPEISNRYLETLLDNLQWKVYHLSRAWGQLWDNAEAARKRQSGHFRPTEGKGSENNRQDRTANDKRRIYSVDRLWEIQQEKLESLGENPDSENREAFGQRIKQRYGQLASEKKPDEEIVMTFDKQSRRCTLAVKKYSKAPDG